MVGLRHRVDRRLQLAGDRERDIDAVLVVLKLKAAKAAKDRGQKLGGMTKGSIRNRDEAKARAEALRSDIDQIRAEGLTSLRAIAGALNERGISTAQGGKWFAPQVARVLASLGALIAAAEPAIGAAPGLARPEGSRTVPGGPQVKARLIKMGTRSLTFPPAHFQISIFQNFFRKFFHHPHHQLFYASLHGARFRQRTD
jgi:hypothetical protein